MVFRLATPGPTRGLIGLRAGQDPLLAFFFLEEGTLVLVLVAMAVWFSLAGKETFGSEPNKGQLTYLR